ncbi:hypothetical protein KP509_09G093800 [Ceratopteris richardii]|uniref:Pentatricopeptide repeat-containing protein n=1 Tax=Ceratopteris richardii TaxID=49495 RepID=A0A8T2UCY3_CERRI|nr:hypothetical protein KP509_09G093800 [Ceratopteris richardii]
MHLEIVKLGMEGLSQVANYLIYMYVNCGSVTKAQQVFDSLFLRDVVIWTALIAGCAEHGPYEKAFKCDGLMQQEGICPNPVTYIYILKGCASMIALTEGQQIHTQIVLKGLEDDINIGNTLINMFFKWGLCADARTCFGKLGLPDVTAWNILVAGHLHLFRGRNYVTVFSEMIQEGIIPNNITLTCVLNSCSDAGILSINDAFFLITHAYSYFFPTLKHYTCVVDFVGRVGLIDKAIGILDGMPINPDVHIWLPLLGSC